MANLSNFVFFDETSTEQTSHYLANANNAGAITLQVDILDNGTIALTPEGMNDLTNPDYYHPIKCVCLEDFKTYAQITKAGLYMIPFDGIYRLRFVSGGPVGGFKAYGVSIG